MSIEGIGHRMPEPGMPGPMDDLDLKRTAEVISESPVAPVTSQVHHVVHLKESLSNRSLQEIVQNGLKELNSAKEDARTGSKFKISAQIFGFRSAKVKAWEKTSQKVMRVAWLVFATLIYWFTFTGINRPLRAYERHQQVYAAEIKHLQEMGDRVIIEGSLPLREFEGLLHEFKELLLIPNDMRRGMIGIFQSAAQKISNNDPAFFAHMQGHLNKYEIDPVEGIFVRKQFKQDATRRFGFIRMDPTRGIKDDQQIVTNTVEGQRKAIHELVCSNVNDSSRTREQLVREREWELVMQEVASQTTLNAMHHTIPEPITVQLVELTEQEDFGTCSIGVKRQRELILAPRRDANGNIERVHVTAVLHMDLIKNSNILIGRDIALLKYQFDVVIPNQHEDVEDLNALVPGRVVVENLTTQIIDNSREILGF